MKLFYSHTSPYSRKVRLVLLEKGLASTTEEVLMNPFADDIAELTDANPLGKIPTLQLDDGTALYDSPVICHYLDELNDSPTLVPNDAALKWTILRWEALADGMTDAAYNLVVERKRPADEQSASWIAKWSKEITRSLNTIEQHLHELPEQLTLAQLALASAIAYLEFRLPEILYESACPQVFEHPKTMSWYQTFKTRPSMQKTLPHE